MSIDIVSFLPLCGFLLPFSLSLIFGLRVAQNYDSLLKIFYLKHRDEWEKSERPIGMFWKPPDVGFIKTLYWNKNTMSRQRLFCTWLSATPEWVQGDIEASALLSQCRTNFVLCAVFCLIIVIIGLVYARIYN